MLIDEKDKLLSKKEKLKKELSDINKKLKNISAYEYQKKEENFIFCESCNKNISKYAIDKHAKTQNHILKTKLKEAETKNKV
jgi:hypothetical protein